MFIKKSNPVNFEFFDLRLHFFDLILLPALLQLDHYSGCAFTSENYWLEKCQGRSPPLLLLPSWKYILVTSSHHVVCLQCLSLPSWAACMFVFGFVADSLAAATASPLLGQFSDWKCWRLENLTEEVVAGGKWPLYSSFGCGFIFAVLEPLQSACPSLSPAVVF